MKLAYYGGQISPNIVKTPEGFLICKNVPIGRLGEMQYLSEELGLTNDGNPVVVRRDEESLFELAAIASFEGKPVTDEHPPDDVDPSNWANYGKGHAQNVRRGSGADADKMVADLVITDSNLINVVENGVRREVSSGYSCNYSPNDDGSYSQRQIRGNHIAIVDEGRAGKSVCIKDSVSTAASTKPILERRNQLMSKGADKISGILNLFGRSVRDAKTTGELEDMAKDAAQAIDSVMGEGGTDPKATDKKAQDEAFAGEDDLMSCIKELTAAVKGMQKSSDADTPGYATPGKGGGMESKDKAKDSSERMEEDKDDEDRAIGKAIKELLAKHVAGDKKVADEGVSVEAMLKKLLSCGDAKDADVDDPIVAMIKELTGKDADGDGDGTLDEDLAEQEEALTVNAETMDTDNSGLQAMAKDAAIAILKNARPAIAAIKNPNERKRVTDALLQSVKSQLGGNGMAGIMRDTAKAAAKKANDSKPSGTLDIDAQQAAYDKHNPHLKKGAK